LKRSNRLVLLVGVFLAVVAFVGIAVILGNGNAPSGGVTPSIAASLPTVIAAKDIPLGVKVTADMVTTAPKKIDTERNAGAFADTSQVIGKVARRPITTGGQVVATDFADFGSVTTIEVPKGKLAMSVQVDQVTGVGTLIKAGDYVDMVVGLTGDKFPVVTLNPDDKSITVVAGLNSTSVKILLQGMQVLGTLLPPPPAAAEAAPAPSGQPATGLNAGGLEMVIVAVDAQQAEILKFAQLDGNISLALRSPGDFVDENGQPIVSVPVTTSGITLKQLVDLYGVIRPQLVEAILPAQ
jgi:pilus assembly protein CpaB